MKLFKVRPYVHSPLQCFKCQRLGHTATGYKAKVCCLKCGEEHKVESCLAEEIKCANCKGNHRANSTECTLIAEGKEIEKRRANGESFGEAKKNVQEHIRNFPPLNGNINNENAEAIQT